MPIEFNDRNTRILFGEGDILLLQADHSEKEDIKELVIIKEDEISLGIGEYYPNPDKYWGKKSTEFTDYVRLQFQCVESVDGFIEELLKVKAAILEEHRKKYAES